MYRRYIDTTNFLKLPLTGELYRINHEGVIKDITGMEVPTFYDNEQNLSVNINWVHGFKTYKVALLIAFTFKPTMVPYKLWEQLDIGFLDNNNQNIHPSNVVWVFPKTGLQCPDNKGYYFIPDHTKYVINKDGVILHRMSGRRSRVYVNYTGYNSITITHDFPIPNKHLSTTIGVYRLLGLTFLERPLDVGNLDVNHKDTVKTNDSLDNLEWDTRGENILHAYANECRTDNRPIIVTNHNTGEEVEYFSMGECERQLGLNRGIVHSRLKFSKGKIYPNGISFKYKYDDDFIAENKQANQYSITVVMRNVLTNEIMEFPSIIKCSDYLNVSKKVVQKRIHNETQPLFKHYQFQMKDSLKDWIDHDV